MRKPISILTLFLISATAGVFFLLPEEDQIEKILVQTEFYPVNILEKKSTFVPPTNKVEWIQAKNKKAKNLAFNVEASNVNQLITNIATSTDHYFYKMSKSGKSTKMKWLIEKNKGVTILKLVDPSLIKPVNTGGC